jgi:DNA-binding transcriptional MocR family regulator
MTASEIRELLKVINQPDVISFAGGIPAAELFPYEEIEDAYYRILRDPVRRSQALQYSVSEGYLPLRELICERAARHGVAVTPANVFITCGSQQALDYIGKLFIDPRDRVLMGRPSYLGAFQAFSAYQPKYVSIPTDDGGMCIEPLDAAARAGGKLLYVVPNFQNPSGVTLLLERRQALVETAYRYTLSVIEDDPYGELRYDGEYLPSLLALDIQHWGSCEAGSVIYLGTFSKTFVPALRLGWVIAPQAVIGRLVLIKQAGDLHTSTINQMVAYEVTKEPAFDEHIELLRRAYRRRRDAMLAAMDIHFPPCVRWTRPQGGLFLWVEMPEYMDGKRVLEKALAEKKVAFVPGEAFFADRSGKNTFRLNFSMASPDTIEEGVRRLGSLLQELVRPEQAGAH